MSGKTFAIQTVDRAIELIRSGRTDVRATIHREFPELTRIGIDRVIDIAQEEIAERDGGDAGLSAPKCLMRGNHLNRRHLR